MKHTNHAMSHALTKATAKAEEAKKPTLSLSGNLNKRSTDNPAANMPEVAEKANEVLAAAAQALHDTNTKEVTQMNPAPAETTNVTPMKPLAALIGENEVPAVVPRIDLLNVPVLFIVNTQNMSANTISYFNGKDGTTNEASLDYYRSTRPVDSEDVIRKLVKQFTQATGSKELVLRKRLVKTNFLERDDDGKVDAKSVDTLKDNLLKALEQFRQAILSA